MQSPPQHTHVPEPAQRWRKAESDRPDGDKPVLAKSAGFCVFWDHPHTLALADKQDENQIVVLKPRKKVIGAQPFRLPRGLGVSEPSSFQKDSASIYFESSKTASMLQPLKVGCLGWRDEGALIGGYFTRSCGCGSFSLELHAVQRVTKLFVMSQG